MALESDSSCTSTSFDYSPECILNCHGVKFVLSDRILERICIDIVEAPNRNTSVKITFPVLNKVDLG
jgi:hypothetical protein